MRRLVFPRRFDSPVPCPPLSSSPGEPPSPSLPSLSLPTAPLVLLSPRPHPHVDSRRCAPRGVRRRGDPHRTQLGARARTRHMRQVCIGTQTGHHTKEATKPGSSSFSVSSSPSSSSWSGWGAVRRSILQNRCAPRYAPYIYIVKNYRFNI